ncbi:glycoside hydrolase family 13 protein [Actinophytocola sp.]|uniref:glycoside hydrolase family 13 protein n=1 Tax=Actinophytocola sp. TaxID=1872138 RepID=UPI002D80974A|nr:glycoside hydrolase family 13 protein [Actinophytocola sp.]HET9138454.1 glycoside hydrolase family 13 protein [Actinophytocola sp.]
MSRVDNAPWWRGAVIYQVYPRSFADANGDGIGDLAGISERLPYLRGLGVDALWFSPWYPSPMADAGYDVADYRDIDPMFGTIEQADRLIRDAHGHDLRVVIDIVPNHCSDAHPWFREAVAAGPGSPQRQRFWFRPGRGPDGATPPTDLRSIFGGPAWTRVTEPDGRPGEWYLHLFAAQQPDFNWNSPEVRTEFLDVLRFWLDHGVDGIRIDSAAVLVKDLELEGETAYTDMDGVHEIYREWRALTDGYPGDRVLIGEVWLPDHQRFAAYLRPDELHAAFNFEFLCCPWDAGRLRAAIDESMLAHEPVAAPASWVLSNHDVTRPVSRFGRADSGFSFPDRLRRQGLPLDLELGARRARAGALLCLALPGAAYLYQGEELGLWEVEDIPRHLLQDPMFHRSGGTDPGRDGCRVPIPWSGVEPPFGFSPPDAGAPPWLPQPPAWKDLTVEAQTGDPHSMLELYRAALRLRAAEPALGDGALRWLAAPAGVLAFARDPGFACVVNLSGGAVPLPDHEAVLLTSKPLDGSALPPDTAAWLRVQRP